MQRCVKRHFARSHIKDLGLFAEASLLGEKVSLTTNYYEVVLI